MSLWLKIDLLCP